MSTDKSAPRYTRVEKRPKLSPVILGVHIRVASEWCDFVKLLCAESSHTPVVRLLQFTNTPEYAGRSGHSGKTYWAKELNIYRLKYKAMFRNCTQISVSADPSTYVEEVMVTQAYSWRSNLAVNCLVVSVPRSKHADGGDLAMYDDIISLAARTCGEYTRTNAQHFSRLEPDFLFIS
jgi:hypothetical protein